MLGLNKWDLIFDFTTDDKKKNYEFLDPSEFKLIKKDIDGMDEKASDVPFFPYPKKYGGTLADDANKHEVKGEEDMMAFSIHTS